MSEGSDIDDLVAPRWWSAAAGELLPDPALRLDHELLLRGGLQRLGPDEFVIYKPRWVRSMTLAWMDS